MSRKITVNVTYVINETDEHDNYCSFLILNNKVVEKLRESCYDLEIDSTFRIDDYKNDGKAMITVFK